MLVGPDVTARVVDSLIAIFRGVARDSARVSSTRAPEHGVVVRFLGRSADLNRP